MTMSEDIEFCLHAECTNTKCERHPSQIKQTWFDHSFMDLRGHICKGWKTAEDFGWKCPYTDKHCDTFDCENCEVNAEEERWSEELQGESRIIAEADVLEQIRAEVKALVTEGESRYDLGFNGAVFRVLRIIDKHTRADAPHDAQN